MSKTNPCILNDKELTRKTHKIRKQIEFSSLTYMDLQRHQHNLLSTNCISVRCQVYFRRP